MRRSNSSLKRVPDSEDGENGCKVMFGSTMTEMKPPYSENPIDSKQDRKINFTPNYIVVNQ